MSTINFELSKKVDETKKAQILVRVSVSRSFRVGERPKSLSLPRIGMRRDSL